MQREYEIGRSGDGRPSPTRRPSSGARRVVEPSGRAAASGTGRGAAIRRDVQRALSSRTTLQRAFLLSEILGPPKAFQSNLEQTWEPSAASLPPRGSAEPENGRQHYEWPRHRANERAHRRAHGQRDRSAAATGGHVRAARRAARRLDGGNGRPSAEGGRIAACPHRHRARCCAQPAWRRAARGETRPETDMILIRARHGRALPSQRPVQTHDGRPRLAMVRVDWTGGGA
jgi:hypothetical protein